MSSSYFPNQLPQHIVQLSIQGIDTYASRDSSSAKQGESSSSTYKWKSARKAPDARAKAAAETAIQSKFKANLSEHQHAYLDQYKDLEIISLAEMRKYDATLAAQAGQDGHVGAYSYREDTKKMKAATSSLWGSNRRKKTAGGKMKSLSSHRKNARSGGGRGSAE